MAFFYIIFYKIIYPEKNEHQVIDPFKNVYTAASYYIITPIKGTSSFKLSQIAILRSLRTFT